MKSAVSTAIPGLRLPIAPRSIQKGGTLKDLLDREAIVCLAHNLSLAHPAFDGAAFERSASEGLGPLGILDRGQHLAEAMRRHLPAGYADAVDVLLRSLTPPLDRTSDLGLGVFFYLPHVRFIATYGLDDGHDGGADPFEVSMRWPERTLARLMDWTRDLDPHVRRLCTEGTRPRLPWAMRIPAFVADPRPTLPILEALKDDPDLYVRRSVANHLGDIAKDHPALAFQICGRWLESATPERCWLIRHAVRHPAKKGVAEAIRLRLSAR